MAFTGDLMRADEFDRLRADRLCPGHGPVWDIPPQAGRIPADPHRRHLLFAHVDVDGRPHGPVAEALATVEG